MNDFDFEPVRGLPERLPPGERILWQGSPLWRNLAVHAFHTRKVMIYFVMLGVLQAALQLLNGALASTALEPLLWLLPMGIVAAGILAGLAYASARTTVYTITNKRLVFRIGIALPITINLPFKLIDSASIRLFASGAGDIPVTLHDGNKFAYLVLWPHAKPWELAKPKPAMRSIPNADRVASLLATALSGSPVVAQPAAEASPAAYAPQAVAA
jgi:hypothetical protein